MINFLVERKNFKFYKGQQQKLFQNIPIISIFYVLLTIRGKLWLIRFLYPTAVVINQTTYNQQLLDLINSFQLSQTYLFECMLNKGKGKYEIICS